MLPFESLTCLFTCGPENRGLLRMDFDEAAALYTEAKKAHFAVEIGRKHGGSAMLISSAMQDGRLLSIDKAPPPHDLDKMLGPNVELVTGDSLTVPLPDKSVDFLLIDGDHTYQGAKADFNRWGPLVKEAGTLVFHDMAATRPNATQLPNLAKLRDEILAKAPFHLTHEVGSLSFFRRNEDRFVSI